MNAIKDTVRDSNSWASWLFVHIFLSGLVANCFGGYFIYKEFYLGKKAVMVGSLDSYESETETGATFTKKKK
jgi:hypothetical protein